jgi:hypothetical protein
VPEGEKLYLLPVQDSDIQWYRNVLQNPSLRIDARGVEATFRALPVTKCQACEICGREISGAGLHFMPAWFMAGRLLTDGNECFQPRSRGGLMLLLSVLSVVIGAVALAIQLYDRCGK